jgi:hypothetical protein
MNHEKEAKEVLSRECCSNYGCSGNCDTAIENVAQALKQAEQRGAAHKGEAKRRAYQEGYEDGVKKERERCLGVVNRYKCLCDGLGGCILCRILNAIRSTKEEV